MHENVGSSARPSHCAAALDCARGEAGAMGAAAIVLPRSAGPPWRNNAHSNACHERRGGRPPHLLDARELQAQLSADPQQQVGLAAAAPAPAAAAAELPTAHCGGGQGRRREVRHVLRRCSCCGWHMQQLRARHGHAGTRCHWAGAAQARVAASTAQRPQARPSRRVLSSVMANVHRVRGHGDEFAVWGAAQRPGAANPMRRSRGAASCRRASGAASSSPESSR